MGKGDRFQCLALNHEISSSENANTKTYSLMVTSSTVWRYISPKKKEGKTCAYE